jgi:hypothetical protein
MKLTVPLILQCVLLVLFFFGCKRQQPFLCVWQNPLDYAYDSLILPVKNISFCNVTYESKRDSMLFKDVKKLTINCDSTFTWKHHSCTSNETSFGRWNTKNHIVYLTSNKKIRQKVAKQSFGNLFGPYSNFSNASFTFHDSLIVLKEKGATPDTLYRY